MDLELRSSYANALHKLLGAAGSLCICQEALTFAAHHREIGSWRTAGGCLYSHSSSIAHSRFYTAQMPLTTIEGFRHGHIRQGCFRNKRPQQLVRNNSGLFGRLFPHSRHGAKDILYSCCGLRLHSLPSLSVFETMSCSAGPEGTMLNLAIFLIDFPHEGQHQ